MTQILNQFQRNHRADIEECNMNNNSFLTLFKTYAMANWKGMDCYNAFIKGFGSNFDKFTERELIRFVVGLEIAGLNQKDIVMTVAEKVKELRVED